MKAKSTYTLQIAVLALFVMVAGHGCWWVIVPSHSSQSYAGSSSTGSFCQREFESPEAVAEFNLKAKAWFLARGFLENNEEDFRQIAGSNNWSEGLGVLLLLKHDENNKAYVFIPDLHDPEDNAQLLGYHTEFRGTSEEVENRRDEFDKLKNEFENQFPQN